MKDNPLLDLVARWRAGDEQAAAELFRQYMDQLVGLARSRMTAKLSQRLDAEDVVQSAFRSFFVGTRAGRYEIQQGGDLWRLLVAITLHKLQHQVQRNGRAKRDVNREQALADSTQPRNLLVLLAAHRSSPLQAMALAEEVEAVLRQLSPLQQRMLEMRLQGYNLEEIAVQTRRSVRTVSRTFDQVKSYLQQANPDIASVESPRGGCS